LRRYFLSRCLFGLDRLDLDLQFHIHVETIGLAEVDTEVTALEACRRVRTAHLTLQHRIDHALELIDLQRQRLGDTVQRQIALHLGRHIAAEGTELALVGGGRVFRDIEYFIVFRMRVHFFVTEVDRVSLYRYLESAGLRGAIEHHLAGRLVELATPYRQPAHMVRFETGEGMVRVDVVGGRCGDRRACNSGEDGGG